MAMHATEPESRRDTSFPNVRVRDIMASRVYRAKRTDLLRDVYALMKLAGVRHLPVVDDDGVVEGMVSDRDVHRAWGRGADTPVEAFMKTDLEWVRPETSARDAADRLLQRKIGSLPVLDAEHRLVGIVTDTDFLVLVHEALARG